MPPKTYLQGAYMTWAHVSGGPTLIAKDICVNVWRDPRKMYLEHQLSNFLIAKER